MTATTQRSIHMARGCGPGDLETGCACPKEACGHVDSARALPGCVQHGDRYAQTMRSMHLSTNCPGGRPGRRTEVKP